MDAPVSNPLPPVDRKLSGHSAAGTNGDQISPPLLQIPPEIRDAIYSHLFDICQAPGDPKVIHPSYESNQHPKRQSLFTLKHTGPCRIGYQRALPKYQLFPILQTCQQIRLEFQEFLRRNLNGANKTATSRGKGLRYELNVASYPLLAYPVWSTLPLPPEEPYNVIEELRVNHQVREFLRPGGRFYGCGGPGSEPYTLFYLLSDFVFHGPQGFYLPAINDLGPQDGEERPRFEGGRCNPKVKHLIVNVCFETTNAKIEKLEADVKSGEPGAEAVLQEAIMLFHERKLEAADWIRQHIKTMARDNYFDGYVEKLSIFCEGAELWRGRSWDLDEEPEAQFVTIDRGFDRSPDWKQSEEYVKYNFVWGPKPELQKRIKPQQDPDV